MSVLDNINPVGDAASVVNTIGNLVGGARVAKAQRQANELNAKLFRENIQANRDMQDKALSQSSVLNQAHQMQLSGVNPAGGNTLGLSQGAIGGASSSLPSISPVTGFGEALMNQAQIDLLSAQADKIKQETESEEQRTGILASENDFQSAVKDGRIKSLNSSNSKVVFQNEMFETFQSLFVADDNGRLSSKDGSSFYTNPYVGQLYQEYQSLYKSLNKMDSEISKTDAETLFTNIKSAFEKDTFGDRVRAVKLSNDSTQMSIDLGGAELQIKRTENDQLQFNLKQSQKYDDAERIVAMFGDVTSSISDIAGATTGKGVVDAMKRNADVSEGKLQNDRDNTELGYHIENRKRFESSRKHGVPHHNIRPSGSSVPRSRR